MATWQLLLAAGIGVLVAILTNWLTSAFSRPSRGAAFWAFVGAFALSVLGLWLTDSPAGDPCAAVKGKLEPISTTVARGGVKIFAVSLNRRDSRELVYDWNALRGVTQPGLNSNSSQTQYQAPADWQGEDAVSVHVHIPGCGEQGAVTWTASVAVVDVVTELSLTDTPTTPLTSPTPAVPTPTPLTPTPASPSPTPTLSLGAEGIRDKDRAVMVFVPAGAFKMGSTDADPAAQGNEKPAHDVTLDAFWIDKFEITNFQYAQCANAGVCPLSALVADASFNNQAQPVVGVSWQDAADYCAWAGARLPTEAEWEYAARGPDSLVYPWGNTFDGSRTNFCDANCSYDWKESSVNDGYALTALVGSYATGASWVGALDMAGNVWEWVNDWYQGYYYARFIGDNPLGPTEEESDGTKVLRGGAWLNQRDDVRCALRPGYAPLLRNGNVGFRCASTSS